MDLLLKLVDLRREHPLIFGAIVIALTVLVGAAAYFGERDQQAELERQARQMLYERAGPELKEQLQQLENIGLGLHSLSSFIESQERKLRQEQEVLDELSQERERLEPIVNADREVIDAIFRVQADRDRMTRYLEWLVAFLLGIFSSFVASLAANALRRR